MYAFTSRKKIEASNSRKYKCYILNRIMYVSYVYLKCNPTTLHLVNYKNIIFVLFYHKHLLIIVITKMFITKDKNNKCEKYVFINNKFNYFIDFGFLFDYNYRYFIEF